MSYLSTVGNPIFSLLNIEVLLLQGGDQYAKSYCWIHGSSYIGKHLQGQATGCFVHPDVVDSAENEPVTSYYLWLPLLLTFCFLFSKALLVKAEIGDSGTVHHKLLYHIPRNSKTVQQFMMYRPRIVQYNLE